MGKPTRSEPDQQRAFKRQGFLDAVADDPHVSHGVYCVLSELAHYANNKTGRCWPGHTKIAVHLRCTTRTVRTHIKEAIELGYVEKEKGGSKAQPAAYRLIMPPQHRKQCHPVFTAQHRKLGAPTPETGRTNTGRSKRSHQGERPLTLKNSQELSLQNEDSSSRAGPVRNESESAFSSERDTKPRAEGEPETDESRCPSESAVLSHEDRGDTDPVIRRAIEIFVDRENSRATRRQMIETVDACRFELNVDDRVIEEALGKVEEALVNDPSKLLHPRYLTATVAQQYAYNSGREPEPRP